MTEMTLGGMDVWLEFEVDLRGIQVARMTGRDHQ